MRKEFFPRIIIGFLLLKIIFITGSLTMIYSQSPSVPFTYLLLNGEYTPPLALTYSVYGVCSSNTKFFKDQIVSDKIPVFIVCKPECTGDEIRVNIVKPKAFNMRLFAATQYNNPAVRNLLVKIIDSKPIEIVIAPLVKMNIFYVDLSVDASKQQIINKIRVSIDSLHHIGESFYIFSSNHRHPLIYSSAEYFRNKNSFIGYLNRLASLNPDPPFASDDANRIHSDLFGTEQSRDFEFINLHLFSNIYDPLTYNILLRSLINIFPLDNTGKVCLYQTRSKKKSTLENQTRTKLRRNKVIHISY